MEGTKMVNERMYANYPEGFDKWNERLFDLFLEGVSKFPPELILGTIESVKILYMSKGIEITQQPSSPVEEAIPELIEEPTDIDDINKELVEEEDDGPV